MKIALISLNDISRGYLPLGILYLAGNLRQAGHIVRLYHTAICTEKEIGEKINQFLPDVIGLSFMTPYVNKAKRIAGLLKKDDRVIIAGGPHATALPEDVLSESTIDFVVCGEGEITFKELLEVLECKRPIDSVQGIIYRDSADNIRFTQTRPLIKDLDLLPPPAYDLLPIERYIIAFRINPSFGFKGIPIMSSRGCPYNCIFCQPIHGKSPRYRSVEKVIEEMVKLKKQYKLEGFNFCDDTLTLNRAWVLRLC